MRLRRPCEHGRYDEHAYYAHPHKFGDDLQTCPGGEFLADDTLIIEKGTDPQELARRLFELGAEPHDCAEYSRTYLVLRGDGARLKCEWIPQTDALAVREGEG